MTCLAGISEHISQSVTLFRTPGYIYKQHCRHRHLVQTASANCRNHQLLNNCKKSLKITRDVTYIFPAPASNNDNSRAS